MLTHYYKSPHVIELLRNGPGGAYFDGFAQELCDAGYARITAVGTYEPRNIYSTGPTEGTFR